MGETPKIQIERNEEQGLTVWIDKHSQSVAIGLDASWYVRSMVSLPVELSNRELHAQVSEELQIQFPADSNDWFFDCAALHEKPSLDGLRVWEVFALASQRMASIRKMSDENQWRLTCVAPLTTLAQAQLGTGVCFYPTRQQRQHQLWRKRCIKGGVMLCAGLVLSLGLGSGYSLASAYWDDSHYQTKEIAQAVPQVESHPSAEPWMEKEFQREKQPLEFYSLQDLRFVGFIQQGKSANALILVRGQQRLGIQSVPVGAYLGQNFGRVLQITHNAVLLHELHQDDSGRWMGRDTSLQLTADAS